MALKPTKSSGEALRAAGALSTVGLAFVLALIMGFWMGDRLDAWLGTTPWLTLLGFFLGLAAGIVNVFRIVKQSYPSGTTPARPADGANAGAAPPPARDSDIPADSDAETH
jgi:ATP synthase protein I